jgi:hypothetical protein
MVEFFQSGCIVPWLLAFVMIDDEEDIVFSVSFSFLDHIAEGCTNNVYTCSYCRFV